MLAENNDSLSYAKFASGGKGASYVYEAFHGFVWNYSTNTASNTPPFQPQNYPMGMINGQQDTANGSSPSYVNNARPFSSHPGGAMVAFCDGHSRFLTQEIDYGIYCLLMSPNGKGVKPAGFLNWTTATTPNNSTYLINTPMNDSNID
jgi:prepilin-type processing-associated H-X9-DG protein